MLRMRICQLKNRKEVDDGICFNREGVLLWSGSPREKYVCLHYGCQWEGRFSHMKLG